jgi:hypothetical protein
MTQNSFFQKQFKGMNLKNNASEKKLEEYQSDFIIPDSCFSAIISM